MRSSLLKQMKNSFSLQLILMFIGITLGTTLALNYYFYSKAQQELYNDLVGHGQSFVRLLADSSILGVFTGNKKMLEDQARIYFQDERCRKISIYDWEGTLLVNFGGDLEEKKDGGSRLAPYKEISKALGPITTFYPEYSSIVLSQAILPSETYDEDDLFFSSDSTKRAMHPEEGQPPLGYVAVVLSTDEVEAKVTAILMQNLVATFVIILFSSGCIFLMLRRMTQPLKLLVGEIVKHSPNTQENAQADLSGNFGEMIEIIQNSYLTIAELKNNLEEKVLARTSELVDSNAALGHQKIILEKTNSDLVNTLAALKRAHDQLVQSEKMAALGQLVGGLSHEINNALNFITGAVPLLDRNLKNMGGPPSRESNVPERLDAQGLHEQNRILLDNIMEGVRRISELTRNLRVFSYSNPDDCRLEDIHIGLSASIGIVRSRYGKLIVIKEQFARDLPQISCNIGQLNQVFMNLLLNASQAIHGEGTIIVKTSFDQKAVRIAVSDTGGGIPEERLSEVFNPFYTTKKIGEGTGLGLSISYSIIDKHGGKIDVYSKPGEGTTFEITLPIRA